MQKKIPADEAILITCADKYDLALFRADPDVSFCSFHGRTIAIVSFSTEQSSKNEFGPFVSGMMTVPYNNVDALRDLLEKHGYVRQNGVK